jgi:thiamine-phosphate pyrophosphorylase
MTWLTPFYPIVPDAGWVERIVPLGVELIQLRYKGAAGVRAEIDRALTVCRLHGCQLIVNDHWQEAIAAGADFIHLGQEDLAAADLAAIRAAGLKLGLSTHDPAELAIALAAKPDYVALGPIYETKLKAMRWAPQGLDRIGEWARQIAPLPLVAIGGLTPERATLALAAGAHSAAVVTDFLNAPDPEARVKSWLAWARTGAS